MNSNVLHEYSENTIRKQTNTNSLVSRDLIDNSSEEERDRKNNTSNNMEAILDSFKTTFSTFSQEEALHLQRF